MIHTIPEELLSRKVKVALIGAGGTGSRVLEQLLCLHRAIVARGHPHGLSVTVFDDDTVSEANIGRQAFYPSDIGLSKARVLVNRVNMALGGSATWEARCERVQQTTSLCDFHLVIGCVDNRAARKSIFRAITHGLWSRAVYWLDFGNRANDGQAILGEVRPKGKRYTEPALPHVGELFPDLLDPSKEEGDDTPSCSLAEALDKQSLYVNQAVSVQGMNIIWNLMSKGSIDVHGVFINLDDSMVMPLRVDPEQWARFNAGPLAKKKRVRKQP